MEVSEKMSADEKSNFMKMIFNMDGNNIPFSGFVLVLLLNEDFILKSEKLSFQKKCMVCRIREAHLQYGRHQHPLLWICPQPRPPHLRVWELLFFTFTSFSSLISTSSSFYNLLLASLFFLFFLTFPSISRIHPWPTHHLQTCSSQHYSTLNFILHLITTVGI